MLSSWGLFPDEFPDAHSSDGYGIRPWQGEDGGLAGFVFAISPRLGRALAERLGSGQRVNAQVRIDAEIFPSSYRVPIDTRDATLPGSGPR